MVRIPDEQLEAVRSRISMVDLVGRHVTLRRAGKNWKGLCPFHAEKTPSFVVNEERGSYHCFGCGAGGSAFRFVMEAEGLTFPEAVRYLAERAGVQVDTGGGGTPEAAREIEERRAVEAVLAQAARYYRHQLTDGRAGADARTYLARRGVTAELAERFQLGCAPPGWDNLSRYLKRKGVDLDLATRAGLVVERRNGGHYDRLRDRLVFPIHGPNGRVVSFGGRVLGAGEPKYLNGPESPVFQKGELLYGLHQGADRLRKERRALLVEGYMDVLALFEAGHENAVATLGTALTPRHLQVLRRRVDEVVMVYDGDTAGRRAALRSLETFLQEGFACRAVLLAADHDPDSFVRAGGDLEAAVVAAQPLFDLYLADAQERQAALPVEGRVRVVDEVAATISAAADPLARDLYVRQAAESLGVDVRHLAARLRRDRGAGPPPERASPASVDPVERGILECLVNDPETRRQFSSQGVEEWMAVGPVREAAAYVAGCAEPAHNLVLEDLEEPVRRLLSEIVVSADQPSSAYDLLEARLQVRHLEKRAAELVCSVRAAETAGDTDRILELLRHKTELDGQLKAARERATGRSERH